MSRTSEYTAWQNMKDRCLNPNAKKFPRYGGRGISLDPRWFRFDLFLEDMGRKPAPEYSLDREDNDGNYTKTNCRWATVHAQNRNRNCNTVDMELADKIRSVYAAGQFTQRAIADYLGVDPSDVSRIISHITWER